MEQRTANPFPTTCLVVLSTLAASLALAAPDPPPPLEDYPATVAEALERYPILDANRAALEIEALSADLGIDLAPRSFESRRRPTEERVREFKDVKKELGDYLERELTRTDRGIAPAPEVLEAFLASRRETIESLRDRLVAGETPQWERNLDKLWDAPIPNLLGHITLQRLLLGAALERAASGDAAGALSYLDASWQLNRSLRDEPFVITQLIAVAIVRLETGTLRRLEDVPDPWIERLREHDYRVSLTNALWLEGWVWREADADAYRRQEQIGWFQRVLLAAGKPYFRICLDEAAGRWREFLRKVAEEESLCDADLGSYERELFDATPWWNAVAKSLLPNVVGSLGRIARLELDLETTALILEIESHRRETGAPPATLEVESSSACPSARWTYERRGDTGYALELDRTMRWENQTGTILPTRFEVGADPDVARVALASDSRLAAGSASRR